jgi:alkyl hydroperoxide reductase subunit AhpC
VPAFEARTIGGQRLTFPNDYRGKLVMVDFWATWCRPCVSEIPNVVETYQAFHARGFEIVGITLDSSAPHGSPAEVLRFTRGANASWPQIYENAMAISQKFGVDNIPAAFLVDGDTGRLLASGESLRGTRLRATIEKCLEQKKGSLHDGK